MHKKIAEIYKDYPEMPYIAPERDQEAWAGEPEAFPYGVVEKRQMQRLPEGILPGDVIFLWRVHFGNFTNQSVIPQYFEYRYGVNSEDCEAVLLRLGYIRVCGARESLPGLNMNQMKKLLEQNELPVKGKRGDLLQRLMEEVPEEKLEEQFAMRRYAITPEGSRVLEKYDDIVQRHGPKM